MTLRTGLVVIGILLRIIIVAISTWIDVILCKDIGKNFTRAVSGAFLRLSLPDVV